MHTLFNGFLTKDTIAILNFNVNFRRFVKHIIEIISQVSWKDRRAFVLGDQPK